MSAVSDTQQPVPQPWARAFGLLLACVVVGIGLMRQVTPETILLRASVVGLIGGSAAKVVISVWSVLTPDEEDD